MKILKASVYDPRKTGTIAPPYLTVEVDEEPGVLGRTFKVSSSGPQLSFVQHGPFWTVDPLAANVDTYSEDDIAALANSAAPTRLEKVVPVEVGWGVLRESEETRSMFISVQRARSLLRKNKQNYQYTLSDVAARQGKIQWDLETHPMMCMLIVGESICAEPFVTDVVNIHGTQMPACRTHISRVRHMAKNLRLERSKV